MFRENYVGFEKILGVSQEWFSDCLSFKKEFINVVDIIDGGGHVCHQALTPNYQ